MEESLFVLYIKVIEEAISRIDVSFVQDLCKIAELLPNEQHMYILNLLNNSTPELCNALKYSECSKFQDFVKTWNYYRLKELFKKDFSTLWYEVLLCEDKQIVFLFVEVVKCNLKKLTYNTLSDILFLLLEKLSDEIREDASLDITYGHVTRFIQELSLYSSVYTLTEDICEKCKKYNTTKPGLNWLHVMKGTRYHNKLCYGKGGKYLKMLYKVCAREEIEDYLITNELVNIAAINDFLELECSSCLKRYITRNLDWCSKKSIDKIQYDKKLHHYFLQFCMENSNFVMLRYLVEKHGCDKDYIQKHSIFKHYYNDSAIKENQTQLLEYLENL